MNAPSTSSERTDVSGRGALHVAILGPRPAPSATVAAALSLLTEGSARRVETTVAVASTVVLEEPRWTRVLERARRYLDLAAPDDRIVLTAAERPEDLRALAPGTLALLVLDVAGTAVSTEPAARTVAALVARTRAALPPSVEFVPTATTVLAYHTRCDEPVVTDSRYTLREPVAEPWLLAADVVCVLVDSVQDLATARFRSRGGPVALGLALTTLLDTRAGASWGLHYYTGSIVARLIDQVEDHAARGGNPVVRAPSEHGLSCGALARWQLDRAPFLMIMTSGMVDELRGTLANLRDARAAGVILAAESSARTWRPFQGTVHATEDSRTVLAARGLRCVYLDDPRDLDAGLAEVAAAYDAGAGPVVVLATRAVLDARGDPAPPPPPPPPPRTSAAAAAAAEVRESSFGRLVELLDNDPCRLLAQVGACGREDVGAVYDLARQAGIALADSLTLPGTVCGHHDGVDVPEYLGTLSLYGYSPPVHAFLHDRGTLRPASEQALLFLASAIPEIATPFSPRLLRTGLRVLQTASVERDLAPFTDLGVVGELPELVRALRARLDVDPDVLALRRRAIDAVTTVADDVVGDLPLRPMTPNYFFRALGDVLGGLITRRGYRYTGVYDVGRGGLAAVCRLPRTGPGHSGWFGRALMGDALQAVPAVALTKPGNVLAFVGDGAAALVPDIVPTLVEHLVVEQRPLEGNLTVFRLVNGAHSVIRTYREGHRPEEVSRQTTVVSLREQDWEWEAGGVRLAHRWLDDVDPQEMGEDLTRSGRVNLFSVRLAHNNEGDGISALSASGWQRAELSDLARTVAAGRSRRRAEG